jgi:hypothetical protein
MADNKIEKLFQLDEELASRYSGECEELGGAVESKLRPVYGRLWVELSALEVIDPNGSDVRNHIDILKYLPFEDFARTYGKFICAALKLGLSPEDIDALRDRIFEEACSEIEHFLLFYTSLGLELPEPQEYPEFQECFIRAFSSRLLGKVPEAFAERKVHPTSVEGFTREFHRVVNDLEGTK